ncbi:exopolysaccharide biosynthesis polyprenyl glycosylphosphotransferase [Pontibacter silvestris]|uniref:Exopolysaccharide biosynthesis polyprenyl glycosylphosphotransferase n=1 Tax=Pontibacter silvestris TaxID=2305183 RepID=A0ABW4WY59_9BACT|nr:exopolysaccharide biosynthesis polyprenyl glycosylphosphotransferase [Pontibacter silvestris]MCC9138547.1 exopolysaccharide biosynthesis polyprenyl glycosylphosphotransferase [Pontibacter silvestris]
MVTHLGGDILSLLLVVFISIILVWSNIRKETDWILFTGFTMGWFLIGYFWKLYSLKHYKPLSTRLTNFLKVYLILIGIASLLYFIYPELVPDKDLIIGFVLAFPVFGIPINFLVVKIIKQLKSDEGKKRHTLIAGVGVLAANVEKELTGHEIKGFIKCTKEECQVRQDKIVGEFTNIHSLLKDNQVDEIVIALPVKASKKIRDILVAADFYGVRVKYIPDYQDLFGKHYRTIRYGNMEAVNVRQLPLDETFSLFIKNCFDIAFSLMAMFMLLPLFLIIAVLIKVDSPGSVFYCPTRIGRAGKPFKVYKFRTMRENDASSGGQLSTKENDPRITKVGRILRKYSLDELPQFINVYLGNMSVVGPRPHRSFLNQQLQESEEKYMIRHYFKPGITGWAQVNGWRGPTETKEQKKQRTLHDIWYMENWSLVLDLKIIYLTIFSRKTHTSAF